MSKQTSARGGKGSQDKQLSKGNPPVQQPPQQPAAPAVPNPDPKGGKRGGKKKGQQQPAAPQAPQQPSAPAGGNGKGMTPDDMWAVIQQQQQQMQQLMAQKGQQGSATKEEVKILPAVTGNLKVTAEVGDDFGSHEVTYGVPLHIAATPVPNSKDKYQLTLTLEPSKGVKTPFMQEVSRKVIQALFDRDGEPCLEGACFERLAKALKQNGHNRMLMVLEVADSLGMLCLDWEAAGLHNK